ncbi:class I SAM-dependent methyltransferase [Flavihumibacter rivuli]|uniref:class I SAM-dependent methyltransferase n=1 Tax=Flavihumibacter rivuli TaxID=2838156 RepID=UPI001BDEC05A|nr:class I SAM-dependent methyltransferase [Flavihumibacter rivuli]ULQ57421.1 class I SAM-dependent methyltransferase [Flavihumibacter rivuli]
MDLVDQQYWNASYDDFKYYIESDKVTEWLDEQFFKKFHPHGEVFELGCFPGRYLLYFGKKGFKISGMDLTPHLEDSRFKDWINAQGVNIGRIEQGDVLEYTKETRDKFDVVCSIGFIEHFQNFQEIIGYHDLVLKPGGWLVITTPNFRGPLQHALHQLFDKENLGRHYLPAMQPGLWSDYLKQLNYTVEWSGYFGGFDFWCDHQQRNLLQRVGLKVVYKLRTLFSGLPSNGLYSPYCGIIARKKVE